MLQRLQLRYDCKDAPNISNLVERYFVDWDERIDKAKCARRVTSVTTAQERRYGFAADVLFVREDVKVGTVLMTAAFEKVKLQIGAK